MPDPEIRFDGYSAPWYVEPIGDIFTERVESFIDGELLSVTTRNGIKKFSDIGRHNTSNDDKSKYKRVQVGDIAYNSMRMWQGASGYSPYEGIVSPAYTVIAPRNGISSRFFGYLFKTSKMIDIFRLNSQGLTSDTWNLKFPALSQISVSFPSLEEQKQIATFMVQIDAQLQQQNEKLMKLRNLKRSMLVKMFPQNGNSVPEIRFGTFNNDWCLGTVGDLGNLRGGGTPSTSVAKYWAGDIPWFTPAEIDKDGSGEVTTSHRTISTDGLKNSSAKLLPAGTVLITTRASIGHVAVTKEPATTNQGFTSLIPHSSKSTWFIYNWVLSNQHRLSFQAAGSTFLELSAKSLAELEIYYPAEGEQQAIGNYFLALDNLIDLESQRLRKLTQLKSTLLQKMFI